MRNFSKHISCLTGLLLTVFMMQGQPLPSLGIAKEIKRATLPDGIQVYLVTNPAQKGFADFALVQRDVREPAQAREALVELPHFSGRKPYKFLADNGVGYSEEGYVSQPADAVLYTLHNVPTYRESVADSTLLMLFDIASTCRKPQAIIVAGDIDAARVQERMGLLSMMVPTLEKGYDGQEYLWSPRDSVSLLVSVNTTQDVAAINAIFSTERLPKEEMDTPTPGHQRIRRPARPDHPQARRTELPGGGHPAGGLPLPLPGQRRGTRRRASLRHGLHLRPAS